MTDAPRLTPAVLAQAPAAAERPRYDRPSVRSGVVHLGIGAFHRAHQAAVFEACLDAGDLRWGVTGVSLRSPSVRDQLAPQEGLYTLSVRDGSDVRDRVIGSVGEVLVAPEDPAAVVSAIASADTHLVTLTVTEKGYKLDPATGALRRDDADVASDLASLDRPRTAPGFIAAGLAQRQARGLPPLTIVSCDNLPENGHRLRAAVLGLVQHDPALSDWIYARVAFPQTMVDRIVPATTEADVDALAVRAGYRDAGTVKTEPFLQWVVEDRFAGERPDLTAAGVQLTRSVAPWEEAKLRLLNGAHSGLSYLGALAGLEFVHEVVARPAGRAFVEALWDEAQTTLSPPAELDLAAYRRDLMARFDNAALQHRTRQIAMDGSQKLPQRLLATAAARLDAGLPIDRIALGVAAWMQWVSGGTDDRGGAITVDDPMAGTLLAATAGSPDPLARTRALLALRAIFPERLAGDPRFEAAVAQHLTHLCDRGASKMLLS